MGLFFVAASADEKSSALGREALGPGASAARDLTGELVSVGRRRHSGCSRLFRCVGRVLDQARKPKYGHRADAIDDQHTPGPTSRHAAIFRRQCVT